jgi:hypothetical protein
MGEKQNLPIRMKELSRDDIKRAKNYLHKISHIPEVNWIPIEDLAKVRNCIVHAMGDVKLSSDRDYLRQLASKHIGLSISRLIRPF